MVFLATDEECKIGFRREDLREGGGYFDGGVNVFIAWNFSVTGNPDIMIRKGSGWESGEYSANSCYNIKQIPRDMEHREAEE